MTKVERIIMYVQQITREVVTLTPEAAERIIEIATEAPDMHRLETYRFNGANNKYDLLQSIELNIYQFAKLMAINDQYYINDIHCYKHILYLKTDMPARIMYLTGSDIHQIL